MNEDVCLCPHCGAVVSGNTEYCPRCDGLLAISNEFVRVALDMETESDNNTPVDEDQEALEILLARPAQMASKPIEQHIEPNNEDNEPASKTSSSENSSIVESNSEQAVSSNDISQNVDIMTQDEYSEFDATSDEESQQVSHDEDTGEYQAHFDDPLAVITHDTPRELSQKTPPQGSRPITPPVSEEAHTEPVTYGQLLLRPAPVPMPEPLPALETQSQMQQPLPPAPFTPPPIMAQPSATLAVSDHSYQQRVMAYAQGGYRLLRQTPHETVMAYGKSLSIVTWVIAVGSGFGILWYWFMLLLSGFRADRVYILLEPDGYVYEEGPGAAHIRYRRSKNSRRWGVFGVFMLLVSIFSLFLAILAGGVMIERYSNELNAAYPELGIFNYSVPPADLNATEVQNVRVAVLALLILSALSISGIFAGMLIALIGYLQAAAYRVDVPPLPYMR